MLISLSRRAIGSKNQPMPEAGLFQSRGLAHVPPERPIATPAHPLRDKTDLEQQDIHLEGSIDLWNKHFGNVTPAEFKRRVTGGDNKVQDCAIKLHPMPDSPETTMRMLVNGHLLGGAEFKMGRIFDFANQSVHLRSFRILDPKAQGNGFGGGAFDGMVDLCSKIGIREMHMSATLDVGGYAWARKEVEPKDRKEWDSIRKPMVKRLISGLRERRYHLPIKTCWTLLRNLASHDPKALFEVVKQRNVVGVASNGKPLTIGMDLIKGLPWDGVFHVEPAIG